RIKKVEALSWGEAMMQLMKQAYLDADMSWQSETAMTLPFNELQPIFQPYFPDWQNALEIPRAPFRAGRYIFKVSLGKIWRRIAISGEATLAALSGLILESVGFDSDHLDQFIFTNEVGRKVFVTHPYADGDLVTTEVAIGSLPLSEGSTMEYVFDFGDWWEFTVQLEAIESPELNTGLQKAKKAKGRRPSQKSVGEILERHGKSPEQYPDYDGGW
ncbi:MAG: plasmid pRiA4b ORF-3 family protein, partial [Leptolyngbya sp. SIO3F4]|nr:plasmid pRiA4b ORF-3 family protein [Leptolyngbya sp. SIO3F4]